MYAGQSAAPRPLSDRRAALAVIAGPAFRERRCHSRYPLRPFRVGIDSLSEYWIETTVTQAGSLDSSGKPVRML